MPQTDIGSSVASSNDGFTDFSVPSETQTQEAKTMRLNGKITTGSMARILQGNPRTIICN